MPGKIPEDAIRIKPEPLRKMTAEIFRRLELPDADAKRIAECLVQVDLRGVFTHGTRQVKRYVNEYRTGGLNPRPEIRQVQDTPIIAQYNGDGALGYLVATRLAETAIQKAKSDGIAIAGSRFHGHVGSVGIYGRMAIEHDLVAWVVAGGTGWQPPKNPDATIWNAMGAPPMCFAIPSAEGPPLVLDMNVNFFKDPDLLTEAIQRFPGPVFASLGLRFVSTLLGGMLAGALPPNIPENVFPAARRGCLMIIFRPDTVGDTELFKQEVTRVIASSRQLKPLIGQQSAEVAGTIEWQRERDWAEEGIPIGKEQREMLEEVARELGVEIVW